MPVFKVGRWVEWVSQSQGWIKKKRGHIVEVVAPDTEPLTYIRGSGQARDHESYIVWVKDRFYWPRVEYLKNACKKDYLMETQS